MKRLLAAAVVATALAVPASASAADPTIQAAVAAYNDLGITQLSGMPSGRTVYRTYADYNNEMAALAAANPGVNPARLRPGAPLQLPAPASDAPPKKAPATNEHEDKTPALKPARDPGKQKTRYYLISAEETAQTISEAFEISVARLYEINGLKPGTWLHPGMEIVVPNRRAAD